jgi:hypothetical protein
MRRHVVYAVLVTFLAATQAGGVALAQGRGNGPSLENIPIVVIEPVQEQPAPEPRQAAPNPAVDILYADSMYKKPNEDTSAFFDVMILRPAGALACLGGLVAAAFALPFALPTGSTEKTLKALVVDPFAYTFARPVGKNEP